MSAALPAPAGLGEAGAALWASIADGELVLRADEVAILREACSTRDAIATLAQASASEPAMIAGSRGQQVINPAFAELRQQRHLLASLLRQLDLPEDEDGDSSEWDGLTASQRARKAAGKRWR